jgi:F0F1-type ATP synthase assembly protein I
MHDEALPVSASRQIQWRWIVQMLLSLLGIAILPVIIGILLEWRLRTSPVITLAMMFLGFNLGIVTIYRRIALLYLQLAPPDPVAEQRDGIGETPLRSQPGRVVAREGNPQQLGGD